MKKFVLDIFDRLWSKIEDVFAGTSGICTCKPKDVCAVIDGAGRMGCTKCGKKQK
jgi:hypothetical protein